MENKYGFIPPTITEDNYIFGAGQVPEEVLQENMDWLAFIPLNERQKKGIETYNCTAFHTNNPLEILHKRKFGTEINLSDRALGILAGTQPPGNDPHTVAEALRKNGLPLEQSLPFDETIDTIEKYYSPNPLSSELKAECDKFLENYDFKHEWVFKGDDVAKHDKLRATLKFSPLGVSVNAWQDKDGVYYKEKGEQDNHWTTLYGWDENLKLWKVVDSYEPYLKYLAADYDFGYAKRYWLDKQKKNESNNSSVIVGILEWLKRLWRYFFADRTFGQARSPGWRKLQQEFIKENPFCFCGKKTKVIHHFIPFHLKPELELVKSNLRALCKKHHLEYAHLGSFHSFNDELDNWTVKYQTRP